MDPSREIDRVPWKEHITGIASAIGQVGQYPIAAILVSTQGAFDKIKTVKGAAVVLAGAVAIGITIGVSSVTYLSGIMSAPAELEDLRDYTRETRSQVRDTRTEMGVMIQRLDTLICELREERTGQMPPECERGILR